MLMVNDNTDIWCPIKRRYLAKPKSKRPWDVVAAEVHPPYEPWFVIRIEPQQERSATAGLIGRRIKALLPEVPRMTTRGLRRKKVRVRVPMFPTYGFVKDIPGDETWPRRILATPGVHKFMMINDRFVVLSEEQMGDIMLAEEQADRKEQFVSAYSVGERIRVSDGLFSGLHAEIAALDDEERITVFLQILGRKAAKQLEVSQIEKL